MYLKNQTARRARRLRLLPGFLLEEMPKNLPELGSR